MKCNESRSYLESWDVFHSHPPVFLYRKDGFPNDGSEKGIDAVKHVQNCESCKNWLGQFVNENDLIRANEMKKHCCPRMYAAVEEPEAAQLQIKQVQFKEDLAWVVAGFEEQGGNQLIQFCPWCETKLHTRPYSEVGASDG